MTDNTVKMTINCNGKLIDVSHPKIMGILNITSDSFFDGGRYNDTTSILKQVEIYDYFASLARNGSDQLRNGTL